MRRVPREASKNNDSARVAGARTRWPSRIEARRRRCLRAAALAVVLAAATAVPAPAAAQNAGPARPTGLAAVAVAHDAVTLGWDDPGDDSITGYRILRRDIVNQPPGTFSTVEDDTATADTGYIDDTVQPETRYAYRIVALNDSGASRRSGYVNVTTPSEPEEPASEPEEPASEPEEPASEPEEPASEPEEPASEPEEPASEPEEPGSDPGEQNEPGSDPGEQEETVAGEGGQQPSVDELEVWSGAMTVGASEYAGAPMLGYSRLSSPRLGSMDPERVDFGGSTYFTHYLVFSPQYGSLWFGSGAPLGTMEGLVLSIDGRRHAFADADEAQGIHGTWIYRWDSLAADAFSWEAGHTAAVAVVHPDLEGSQLHGLRIFGVDAIDFDPDVFRYETTAEPGARTVRVRAQSSPRTEIEVLAARSDREELAFEPATDRGSFKEVSLSQTGDTIVVVNTTATDNTESTYVVHVSPSDDGSGGGDGRGGGSTTSRSGPATPPPAIGPGAKTLALPGAALYADDPMVFAGRAGIPPVVAGRAGNRLVFSDHEPSDGARAAWQARMHCLPSDIPSHLGANYDIPWTEDYLWRLARAFWTEDLEADVSMYRLWLEGTGADADDRFHLTPGFWNWTENRSFTTTVLPGTAKVTVVACPADPLATYTITPADSDSNTDGHQVELPSPGDGPTRTSVAIAVLASNGTDMDTYTINIERPVALPEDLPQLGSNYELVWWSRLTVGHSDDETDRGFGGRTGDGGAISDATIHSRRWPGVGIHGDNGEFLRFQYEFTVTELYYRTANGTDRLRLSVPGAQIPDGWVLVVDGTQYPMWTSRMLWWGAHVWDDVTNPNWTANDTVLVALYRAIR